MINTETPKHENLKEESMAVLTPAYGRKYRTQKQAIDAYLQGMDFIYNNVASPYDGKYCSCRDFLNEPVEIRYGLRNEKLVFVTNYEEE